MDNRSPRYLFHPDSIGWLHRRAANGETVLAEDIARIVEAQPELIPDPVLRDHVVQACRGQLRSRRGRPPRSSLGRIKLELAAHQVEVLVRWYRRAERRGYAYAYDRNRDGRLGLVNHVHEIVARRMKLGSGTSLANSLSSLKRSPY